MNIIFLSLLVCAAPPQAQTKNEKPFRLNLSCNVSSKADIYLELVVPKDGSKWQIIGKQDLQANAKKILTYYDLAGVVIDKGEIIKIFFRLKTPDEDEDEETPPGRHDASIGP